MAKKQTKPKVTPKAHTFYSTSGGSLESKKRSCPKCGSGVFLAEHKNRFTCGRCHYTEFKSSDKLQQEEKPKERE